MSTCDRCWKETAGHCTEYKIRNFSTVCSWKRICSLEGFANACMFALHQQFCTWCHLALSMNACLPEGWRLCWNRQHIKRRKRKKNNREGRMQSVKFFLLTSHDKTKEEKFWHWWQNKMKFALLKCNISVEALQHYGVPFSSINLPIFHGCEDLFIDQGMIKWWSSVPQREPSSFSFSFLSLLCVFSSYFSLSLSIPLCPSLLSYRLTLSLCAPLFHELIYYIPNFHSYTLV